jgi:hypothetical protein
MFILLSCTVLCTHIDKKGGDDGEGHCSICLSAVAHIVQPVSAVQVAPIISVSTVTTVPDPLLKQTRFESSLYIRPPPLS